MEKWVLLIAGRYAETAATVHLIFVIADLWPMIKESLIEKQGSHWF
jgi:hypothetical protein